MSGTFEGRKPRVKGSGDHRWEPWSVATLGRGRRCLDCGREDDGFQQPCEPVVVKSPQRPTPKMMRECANILETAPYVRTEFAAWLRAQADYDEHRALEERAMRVAILRKVQDIL